MKLSRHIPCVRTPKIKARSPRTISQSQPEPVLPGDKTELDIQTDNRPFCLPLDVKHTFRKLAERPAQQVRRRLLVCKERTRDGPSEPRQGASRFSVVVDRPPVVVRSSFILHWHHGSTLSCSHRDYESAVSARNSDEFKGSFHGSTSTPARLHASTHTRARTCLSIQVLS